jgi:holo-[acyl-carrier protein] synthase
VTVIIGVGVDVVDVNRFRTAADRTPRLLERLFTAEERITPSGLERSIESLAARFAAKEAVAKALGVPEALEWHHCEVRQSERGEPSLRITGTVAAAAEERGITTWHMSLSHDGPIAIAQVIAESRP